jgi:HAD superfamily hydrolase (TIGR01509 family)
MSLASCRSLSRDAYLFDLDGTLVDSLPVHEQCFRYVLARHYPHALDTFDYSTFLGWRTEDVFRALRITVDPRVISTLAAEKQAVYRQAVDAGMVRLFPKVHEVLTLLSDNRRRLYVVTGGSAKSTATLLDRARLYEFFDGCITGDDTHASKPDPDPFLRALECFHLEPGECLTIEDSEDGALASERAGVTAVLINHGHSAGGRTTFADFAELGIALREAFQQV